MKKITILCLLLLSAFSFSQNEVAKKVQELEKNSTVFKTISVLNIAQNQTNATADKVVNNATYATINTSSVNDIVANKDEFIDIEIPYNGIIVTSRLYKVNPFLEGFHVDTNTQKNIAYNKGVYYRGIVKGDYQSVVSFNFFNNELNAIISSNALSNLIVGKLKTANNSSDYIVYQDADFKVLNDFKCGVQDTKYQETHRMPTNTNKTNSTRCVSVYFEIDYDLYQSNSSNTTTTTNWMTSVFNNVQTLYNNDGITVGLKSMYIWTTQDPYEGVGTSSSDYLYAFNATRPIFDGDVGQLVGIDEGALGGVAVAINGLCSQNNFSYSDVDFNYSTVPTYSWDIEVITHELGHLLGSPHTHGCYWNGNNTAIDGCGAQAGYVEGSCPTGPIPSSTVKGTIMSYCHLISGVGIKFSNGFGPQPTAVILAAVNSGLCLSSDCVHTCLNSVSSISISNVLTTSATVNWVESGSYTSWEVAVYPFGGTPTTWTTVSTNSYTVSGLNPDTYYVAEVRPNCSSIGLVSGSKQIMFITATTFCDGISFVDTGGATNDYSNMETFIRTIIPDVPNNAITLTFTEFSLELNYDYMYIYDGNSITAPDLSSGGFTGSTIPGPFTSTAADGSLTVKFTSDQGVVSTGWNATISCTPNLMSTNSYNGYIDYSYYPNPTNNIVTVSSKLPITNVLIYNIAGQLLYQKNSNEMNTTVDISAFATGTYFFKIKFDDKEAHFKVIRN